MALKSTKEASDPLAWIRALVRRGQYELSEHVKLKLEIGQCALDDIENSILRGDIKKVQKDEMEQALDGKKYLIVGPSRSGLAFKTVGKIVEWFEGEAYFVITAYGSK